jgi:hypothetical protein
MQTRRFWQCPRSRQREHPIGRMTLEQGLDQGTAEPAGCAHDDVQLR